MDKGRYPNIMTINADGSSKLTSAFQKAIDETPRPKRTG